MGTEGQKVLAFFLAVVAAAVLGSVFFKGALGTAGGVENELVTQLKQLERTGFEVTVSGQRLRGKQLQYQRLAAAVEPAGDRAVVTGTLDFNGDFGDGTQVSSLGFERVEFELRDGAWVAARGPAPRLMAIVAALEARRQQVGSAEGVDGGVDLPWVPGRKYQALGWFIRSEKERVAVAEDYRLTGTLRDRPLDEKSTVRLELVESPNTRFVFAPQLE